MATNYPDDFDTLYNPLSTQTQDSPSHAQIHADANDAIEAIESELGATPSGGYANVSTRLDAEAAKTHLNPRGHWEPNNDYQENDVVDYRGYLYRIDTALTSATPFDPGNYTAISPQGPAPTQVSSLKIAGHSYMDPDGIGADSRQCTSSRLQAMLGLLPSQVQNVAISGGVVRWNNGSCTYGTVLQEVNPGSIDSPRVADAGVVFTMFGTNDATIYTTNDTWHEWTFKEAYKSVIARYRAASVYEDTHSSCVYSGSWSQYLYSTTGLDPSGSGLGYHYTNSGGAKVTITTPNDMGRYQDGVWVDLGFIGGWEGATADIYLDGVYHGTLDCGRGEAYGTAFGTNPYDFNNSQYIYNQYTGMIYRMWIPTTPVTDGSYSGNDSSLTTTTLVQQHDIEIRYTGAITSSPTQGDATLKFDYWAIEADEPPLVLVSNMIQPSNPSWVWSALQDADIHDRINVWIQDVVDWFGSPAVRLVDCDTPMGGTTASWSTNSNARYFSTDGLHPNPEGAKVIAEAALEELVAGLNEGVTQRNLLGYWSGEIIPMVELPQWDDGAGSPLATDDDFERTASDQSIIGTATPTSADWIPITGGWGIDEYGQAYLVSTKFENPDFTDDFDRDDSTSVVGNGWTQTAGTWGINSGDLYLTANGGSSKSLLVRDAGSVTQSVDLIFGAHTTSATYDLGIILRLSDANNWLGVLPNGIFGGFTVVKCVAGVLAAGALQTSVLTGNTYGIRAEVGSDNIVRIYQLYEDPLYLEYGKRSTYTYTIVDAALQASNGSATYVGIGNRTSTVSTDTRIKRFRYSTATSRHIDQYKAKQNLVVKDLGSPDVTVGMRMGDDGTGEGDNWQGLVMRYQDPDNFYALLLSITYNAWAFSKVVDATPTTLKAFFGTSEPGTVISAEMSGSNFNFYINGELAATATDVTYPDGDMHGLALHTQTPESALSSRWSEFLSGSFQMVSEYGAMYIDNQSDPSTITLYGPFDGDNGGWGSGIDISTKALRNPITTVTASAATPSAYTLDLTEAVVLVDTSAYDQTIWLPDPSEVPGRMYTVKKISNDSNYVFVDSATGNVDDGASPSNKTWNTAYAAFSFVSDGTDWWIV